MAKQMRREGDFLMIELATGGRSFGRVLKEPLVAFYNGRYDDPMPINEIDKLKIIFKIWVMNSAITSGRWKSIGNLPLSKQLEQPERFINQDPVSKRVFVIENSKEVILPEDDLPDLERAAVWSPEHVEDRLEDHYAGRPNEWVESLKPVRVKERLHDPTKARVDTR